MNKYLIKELMNVNRGSSPRPIIEYLSDSGYRWLKISDFNMYDRYVYETKEFIKESGLKNTRHLPAGTLILTNSATPGIPIFLGRDMCLHDGFLYFTNIKEDIININFLYYWLLYNKNLIVNQANGSVFKNLKKDIVENFEINVPNMDTQLKIVEVLDNINSKIELNNEINNNLYELIKNNYEALISNFDWEEVELGTIANITSGKRPVDKLETGAYPVIGANGIMAYTNDFNFNEDLIITGRVGTLGVVRRYAEQIWASDNTLVIQTKYLNYIENYMKTIDYYSLNRGSTQPLLTQGDLKKQIIMFNEEAVLRFEEENQIFIDKIKNNEKENKNLEQLRDTLLPKLMNGEIDLDNIEI